MRFPQVSERVKEAPAHALRAVFASIGQVLLVTDRMKNKPTEEEKAAGPRADERAEEAAAPAADTADHRRGDHHGRRAHARRRGEYRRIPIRPPPPPSPTPAAPAAAGAG